MDTELNRQVVRIDEISAGGNITVTTLREHLQLLWNDLFAGAPALNSIRCMVSYEYTGEASVPNWVPILSMVTTFSLTAKQTAPSVMTEADLLETLAADIRSWFSTNRPTLDGQLVFDLAVFDLVVIDACIPLREWTKLTLPISSISSLYGD